MPVVVDPPRQEPNPPQISVTVSDGGGGGKKLLLDVLCFFDPAQVKFGKKRNPAGKFTSGAGWFRWAKLSLPPSKTKLHRELKSAARGAKVTFVVFDWNNHVMVKRTRKLKAFPGP